MLDGLLGSIPNSETSTEVRSENPNRIPMRTYLDVNRSMHGLILVSYHGKFGRQIGVLFGAARVVFMKVYHTPDLEYPLNSNFYVVLPSSMWQHPEPSF